MFNTKIKWFALLLLASFQAQAHTDPLPQMSFQISLLHPFTGIDHLLAMLLIGMTAALTPKTKLSLPLVFSFGLLIGTLGTGWLNAAINVEPWVMGSVAVFAALHGQRLASIQPFRWAWLGSLRSHTVPLTACPCLRRLI